MPPEEIERLVETITRECNDLEHLPSNRTRLLRLRQCARLPDSLFVNLVNEARARTKARGNISKPATSGIYPGLKNKAPYFFRVLESLMEQESSAAAAVASEDRERSSLDPYRRVACMPCFQVTVTVTGGGNARIAEYLELQPGRYQAVLLVGDRREEERDALRPGVSDENP